MSSGSASVGRSNRCATTIWKHSPARIASLADSTALGYSPSGVRETKRPDPGLVHSGHHRRGRPGQRGRHRVEAADRLVVGGGGGRLRRLRRQDRVGHQHGRALEVVEHHQVGGEHHAQLGHPQVVGRRVGQPLEPAYDVVGEEADQTAGQRRQVRPVGRRAAAGEQPRRVSRSTSTGSPVGRHTGRRGAQPDRLAVALGQRRDAAHADEASTATTPCRPTPRRARPTPAGRCPGRRRACGRRRPASRRRRAAGGSPGRPGSCGRARGRSSRRG